MTTPNLPPVREMHKAFEARDASYDGVFYTAVRTTGVFCRPTCAARKPRRENVEFFPNVRDALLAGYRPCKRCRPLEPNGQAPEWLHGLLADIDRDPTRRWRDADLRARDIDPGRARRWFKTHYGMTFQAYQRARRLGLALGRIRHGDDLTRAALEHGYDSLSGFREAFERVFGDAPGRARHAPSIVMTRLLTPLGPMVAAANDRGVCLLEFADRRMLETQFRRLRKWFDAAVVPGSNSHIEQLHEELKEYFEGARREFEVPIIAPGSEFQRQVWAGLRRIPYGDTCSYEQLARGIGRPAAQRAVGRANGDNRIAIIIPCHRVVRSDGTLCGYGGGVWRKRHLLQHERDSR